MTKAAESCKCHNSASSLPTKNSVIQANYNIDHDGVSDDSGQEFPLCGLLEKTCCFIKFVKHRCPVV